MSSEQILADKMSGGKKSSQCNDAKASSAHDDDNSGSEDGSPANTPRDEDQAAPETRKRKLPDFGTKKKSQGGAKQAKKNPPRTLEMLFKALREQEADIFVIGAQLHIILTPGTKLPDIRPGKSELNMNMLAYIVNPDILFKDGMTFTQMLADLMLEGDIVELSKDNMIGKEGDGLTQFLVNSKTKWEAFQVICTMRLGTQIRSAAALKPFHALATEVLRLMWSHKIVSGNLLNIKHEWFSRHNAIATIDETFKSAYRTTNKVRRDGIVDSLKALAQHFPSVRATKEAMQGKVQNIAKIMRWAEDSNMQQITMARQLGISNERRDPKIIEAYLQDTDFLVPFLKARSTCMEERLDDPDQRDASMSHDGESSEEEDDDADFDRVQFPSILALSSNLVTRLNVKGEDEKLADATNPEHESDTVYIMLIRDAGDIPTNIGDRAAFLSKVNTQLGEVLTLCHFMTTYTGSEKRRNAALCRELEKWQVSKERFDKIYDKFGNMLFAQVKDMVLHDKPYSPPDAADKATEPYSVFIRRLVHYSFLNAPTSGDPELRNDCTISFPDDMPGIPIEIHHREYDLSMLYENLCNSVILTAKDNRHKGVSYLGEFGLQGATINKIVETIARAIAEYGVPEAYVSAIAEDFLFMMYSVIKDWKVDPFQYKTNRGLPGEYSIGFLHIDPVYIVGSEKPQVIPDDTHEAAPQPGPSGSGAAEPAAEVAPSGSGVAMPAAEVAPSGSGAAQAPARATEAEPSGSGAAMPPAPAAEDGPSGSGAAAPAAEDGPSGSGAAMPPASAAEDVPSGSGAGEDGPSGSGAGEDGPSGSGATPPATRTSSASSRNGGDSSRSPTPEGGAAAGPPPAAANPGRFGELQSMDLQFTQSQASLPGEGASLQASMSLEGASLQSEQSQVFYGVPSPAELLLMNHAQELYNETPHVGNKGIVEKTWQQAVNYVTCNCITQNPALFTGRDIEIADILERVHHKNSQNGNGFNYAQFKELVKKADEQGIEYDPIDMVWKAVISYACQLARTRTPDAYHVKTYRSALDEAIEKKMQGHS